MSLEFFFAMLGLVFLAAPVIAILGFLKARTLEQRVSVLSRRLEAAEQALRRFERGAPAQPEAPPAEVPPAPGEVPAPPPAEVPEPPAEMPEVPPEVPPEFPSEIPPEAREPAMAARSAEEAVSSEIPPPPRRRMAGFEQRLTANWIVWLGALTVGLSAVFLFSYAIEQGWLGPLPRVVLGLILGAALIAGGEWTHRHAIPGLERAQTPDYVPPALTAAGLFALYASLFAAHGLYGLIGPAIAFTALGAVGFAALVLAVRQGWFVALLGLAGGYGMPMLIESSVPNPVPVFTYVFALTLGCLAVMVFRKWWFLAAACLIGSVGWPLLWLIGPWEQGHQLALGLYAVAAAAAFALVSTGLPVKRPERHGFAWLGSMIADTSGIGFVAQGLVLILVALASDYNEAAFVLLGLYAALGMGVGAKRPGFEALAVASALVIALAFLAWPQPLPPQPSPEMLQHSGDWRDVFGRLETPEVLRLFARAAAGFGLLYGLGGFLALRSAATPAVWAGVSAGMPLVLFAVGYWRIGGFEVNVDWGLLAAGLAVAALAAASAVHRFAAPERRDEPLALYAAGCTGALALAFTCVLRDAWLTVALSAEVLALAMIWQRLPVRHLRSIAWAVAGTVLVRLVLNPEVLEYHGDSGLFTWVIYGYGLPAAAFILATRRFGDPRTDPLAALCEAGGLGLAVLTVTLQLRAWTAGSLWQPPYDLFDQAVQSAWWLVAGALLLRHEAVERSKAALYGGRVLLVLASGQILLGHLLTNNPLLSYEQVGSLPLVNVLGLAYLVPAVLYLLIAASPRIELPEQVRPWMRGAALVLIFVWLSLEVRRAFWGSVLFTGWSRGAYDAEVYTYSAVWIAYALALLAVGVVWRRTAARYASLTVLGIAIAKVFLYDMSDLQGLFRVASFLCLGLVLIGVGYVYRRFVFRPAVAEEAADGA